MRFAVVKDSGGRSCRLTRVLLPGTLHVFLDARRCTVRIQERSSGHAELLGVFLFSLFLGSLLIAGVVYGIARLSERGVTATEFVEHVAHHAPPRPIHK